MVSTKVYTHIENGWIVEAANHYDSCIGIKIYGVIVTPGGISIGWQKENDHYIWETGKECILDRMSCNIRKILSCLREVFSSDCVELKLKWTDKAIEEALAVC